MKSMLPYFIFTTVSTAMLAMVLTPHRAHAHGGSRLVEVDPLEDAVTIKSYSEDEHGVDISGYSLSFVNGEYHVLEDLTVESGSLELGAGETVTLSGLELPDSACGLTLYKAGTSDANATDPDKMADFIQWGAPGLGREEVAVEKGVWTEGDFLSASAVFTYTGDGSSENGKEFWDQVVSVTGGFSYGEGHGVYPEHNSLKLRPGYSPVRVKIYASDGVLVRQSVLSGAAPLSLPDFETGAYFVYFPDANLKPIEWLIKN